MDDEARAQLKDDRIRAKLTVLLKKTALIEHPKGTYPASVVVPLGLNSDAITGVMTTLGATPNPNDETDMQKGFGQWAYTASADGSYSRIFIKHPEALAEVKEMFGVQKNAPGEGLALELDLVKIIADALGDLRVGQKKGRGLV